MTMYRINLSQTVYSVIYVEADTQEDAENKALNEAEIAIDAEDIEIIGAEEWPPIKEIEPE